MFETLSKLNELQRNQLLISYHKQEERQQLDLLDHVSHISRPVYTTEL